jgi:hypothetical protein
MIAILTAGARPIVTSASVEGVTVTTSTGAYLLVVNAAGPKGTVSVNTGALPVIDSANTPGVTMNTPVTDGS